MTNNSYDRDFLSASYWPARFPSSDRYFATAIRNDQMASFPLLGEVGIPEVLRPCDVTGDEAAGARSRTNSSTRVRFSCSGVGGYSLPCRVPEVPLLPVTPESSPSGTPDLLPVSGSGFSYVPASAAVGTVPLCFAAFPPQFRSFSAYAGGAESGFVTPEMSPLDGCQQMSPPNLHPFLPSPYVAWPKEPSIHGQAPSYVDAPRQRRPPALTTENYASQSTGNYFGTGNGSGTGSCTRHDFRGVSFHERRAMDLELLLSSDMPEITSRPPYCDVVAEQDCRAVRRLIPLRPPAAATERQFPVDCAHVLPWYLRYPEDRSRQYDDSEFSVVDVEPNELDQYLDRKSAPPSCDVDGNTHAAAIGVDPRSELRLEEVVRPRDPPSTTSPDAVLQFANCEIETETECGSFFDVDYYDLTTDEDNFSSIAPAEDQTNHAGITSDTGSTAFVEDPTGNGYFTSSVVGGCGEFYGASLSPRAGRFSSDVVRFSPLNLAARCSEQVNSSDE